MAADEDRPVVVEITPWEAKRNKLQNAYLWGWVYRYIADKLEECGTVIILDDGREWPYDADMLHDIFTTKFLCYEIGVKNGVEKKKLYSTTNLLMRPKPGQEQRGFANYITQIKHFMIQWRGIDIPPTYNEDYRSLEQDLSSGRYK